VQIYPRFSKSTELWFRRRQNPIFGGMKSSQLMTVEFAGSFLARRWGHVAGNSYLPRNSNFRFRVLETVDVRGGGGIRTRVLWRTLYPTEIWHVRFENRILARIHGLISFITSMVEDTCYMVSTEKYYESMDPNKFYNCELDVLYPKIDGYFLAFLFF
jgi:hypothetical protein